MGMGKDVGVACAVYRGYCTRHPQIEKRRFFYGTGQGKPLRDYLYGRLLAVAESLEGYALSITGEDRSRPTTAERYMQRFAARPSIPGVILRLLLCHIRTG